ncbi:aminoglycoside phosphotransferase [Streptomyces sp. NPDC020951]|uniref:aminoglycoside phosphotransferase n=1 Tax=Streptomyces sp. NPDC020951 TaxID=3365104 RepID=UPI00379D6D88
MATHRLAEIPAAVVKEIEAVVGPVRGVEVVAAGFNSEIAARLFLDEGTVFVKGLRLDHPRVWTQQREADVNAYTGGLAPVLRWRIRAGGWDLLGFEDLGGRHADYSPGSSDLPCVLRAMERLASVTTSGDIELKAMAERMSSYASDPDDLRFFEGDALLHTDWKPDNVLIVEGRAKVVDWAWASRGVEWIDPALWVIWLVASGHRVAEAEGLAALHPAWAAASASHVDAFARAQRRLWESIADGERPGDWTYGMCAAARAWERHRRRRLTP